MSYLNEKTLDIVLEDNTDFGFRLTFKDISQNCTEHPVTGEQINCVDVENDLDITDLTFEGDISLSLDEPSTALVSFTFTTVSALEGILDMTLTAAQIKGLVTQASSTRDKYDPRRRFLGYYDVNSVDSISGITTRLLQGTVYVSDGVTD